MSEQKAVMSNRWATLNTVDEFDMGLNNTSRDIITADDDLSKTVVKSLFIESLIDQLCKLLEKDPLKRHKLYDGICRKLCEMQLIEDTYHIEELASLRGHYQQALLDVMVTPNNRLRTIPCVKLGSSRYTTEFEEISFLAAGGFGKVFKAKNRLDQVVYAVKKISLKYQNVTSFAKKLNEVKTLARLNHPNIVQYKAAWLEPLLNFAAPVPSPEVTNLSSNDSDVVVFQSNKTSSKTNNNVSSQEKENENNLAVCKFNNGMQKSVPQLSALLYVSMQLCDETLSEWLQRRNLLNEPINKSLILYIMIQATTGVQYIHSCNIVHHDIKPRNIFLSTDLRSVQVGDFGLSCCLQGHDHSDCPLEGGQFGTPLYAAPEQLRGCCDSKSDIFSLGLVFIELLTVFSTEMERVKVLSQARSGQLPCSIPLSLEKTIKDMISHKPNKRPTATQLIDTLQKFQQEFSESIMESITMYKDKGVSNTPTILEQDSSGSTAQDREQLLKDKELEIIKLRQMLAQKELEIEELRQLVIQGTL